MAKNIIICCDGTSNNFKNNTHISRLAYMFQESSSQITYYVSGVGGEEQPWYERLIELALGTGIRNRLYRTYNFLVDNYEPNDRIYVFGFSRGAYTIRALAGMINKVGIVKRVAFEKNYTKEFLINQALDLSLVEKHQKQQETDEDHGTVAFKKLYTHDLSKMQNKIEFMGAFDTVATLGIWGGLYSFSWIKGLVLFSILWTIFSHLSFSIDYFSDYWHLMILSWLGFVYKAWTAREREEFYNHTLSNIIKKAVHITAKDEKRLAFRGIPMDAAKNIPNQVETFDIAGVHADIGGGYHYNKSGHYSLLIMYISIKSFAKNITIDTKRAIEVLAEYKNPKLQYNEAKSEYENAQTAQIQCLKKYQDAKLQYNEAKSEYENAQTAQIQCLKKYQDAKLQYNEAKSEYENAKLKYENAKLKYENATEYFNAYKKINNSATLGWLLTNMIAPRSINQWIDNVVEKNKYKKSIKKIKDFFDDTPIINAIYKLICWLIRPIMYMCINSVGSICYRNKKLFVDCCFNIIALAIIVVFCLHYFNNNKTQGQPFLIKENSFDFV